MNKRITLWLLVSIVISLNNCDKITDPDSNQLPVVAETKMGSDVYHIGFVLFLDENLDELKCNLRKIKEYGLGENANGTAFESPKGIAQLAVHIEFGAYEYSSNEAAALEHLKTVINLIISEGFAVHLLLSGDYIPADSWMNVDWYEQTTESKGYYLGEFCPYQPSYSRELDDGNIGPWDLIFENFHIPVIDYFKNEGLLKELAVLYIMNEFGYMTTRSDDASHWGDRDNWDIYSAECLARTAERGLNLARQAADGQVQVGLKFANLLEPLTGWGVNNGSDQFEYIINNVMAPNGDNLGFDAYWTPSINLYNPEFKYRLDPFLSLFPAGSFTIPEYGQDVTVHRIILAMVSEHLLKIC